MIDLDPERLTRNHFAVGAIGALITAVKFTPGASWKERAFNAAAVPVTGSWQVAD